jgi:peptidoglycan/xylan/chitin deacetylase (PgdA/CDA1 family)
VGQSNLARVSDFCRNRLGVQPTEFLSWDDLTMLLRAGHEVGSHTRTHADLAALGAEELEEEVEGSRIELMARLGPVRHFAWPYGRFSNVKTETIRAIARAGYESCASTERGCHIAAANGSPMLPCLRRDHIDAAWPLSHMLYLLSRSAIRARADAHLWPAALTLRSGRSTTCGGYMPDEHEQEH